MHYRLEYKHKQEDFIDVWNIEQEYLNPATISSVEQTLKWNEINPDTHIFVRDVMKNKIVGEVTLLPLTEEQFLKFINNELEDTEMNDIISYKPNIECYLLFSAIAIDKEYRNDHNILFLLLKGINEKTDILLNKGINFLNMCAVGETKDGKKFIESFLNLKYKRDTKEGYKLYSFDNKEDFIKWKQEFPKYIERYKEKFIKE